MSGAPASTIAELASLGIDLEYCSCAFCGSDAADTILVGGDRLHGRPGRFQVVKCQQCGLMRTNPRPTVGCIGKYYPEDYEPYLDTASEDRNRWRHTLSRLFDPLDVAIPALSPAGLLEIGAASGNYMLAMQRKGWQVSGVEFDPAAAATAARRTGAPVRSGDLLALSFPAASFDLVCGWMVMEHLHDPVAALRRVFTWLKPGGWFAFSVPDAGSWQFRTFGDAWFALQLPTHLYHFSEPMLRTILAACGYDSVSVMRQGTLYDVGMSVAYQIEDRRLMDAGQAQAFARSFVGRALARGLGAIVRPIGITARLTVWARRPAVATPTN